MLPLIVSCSKDDDGGGGLDDPNKPLSEKLAEMKSTTQLFYDETEGYQTYGLSYNVYYFFQDGYVLNYRSVTDDWGNNGQGFKCVCPEFHYDHTLADITVLVNDPDRYTWMNNGRTFTLSYSNNVLSYKQDGQPTYWTASIISDTQHNDYQNKVSSYQNCHN